MCATPPPRTPAVSPNPGIGVALILFFADQRGLAPDGVVLIPFFASPHSDMLYVAHVAGKR